MFVSTLKDICSTIKKFKKTLKNGLVDKIGGPKLQFG